nr:hypothetical protein [Tanacetum cinerariifolium]
MEAGSKDRWKENFVLDFEGNPTTTTQKVFETYKNVTQEIRDQLNAEAEAVQIILTGIDNDIYSIVDACPNACEMWKAIERLKKGIWACCKRMLEAEKGKGCSLSSGEDVIVKQIAQNDEDFDLAKERELLASLIAKLKCEIDESKNR